MSRRLAIQALSSPLASSSRLFLPIRAFSSSAISQHPPNGSFADSISSILGPRASSSPSASASTSNSAPLSQAEAMLRGLAQSPEAPRKQLLGAGNTFPPSALNHKRLFPETRQRRRKPALFGPEDGRAGRTDPFKLTKSNPMDHVYNPHLVQAFLDPMGRIKPRSETQLTKNSQKKIGKMVRRARAMGLISTWTNRPSKSGYGSLPSSGLSLDDDSFY